MSPGPLDPVICCPVQYRDQTGIETWMQNRHHHSPISLSFLTQLFMQLKTNPSQSYDDNNLSDCERPHYILLYSCDVDIRKESNRSMKEFASTY